MLSVASNITIVSLNKFLNSLRFIDYKKLNNACEDLRKKKSKQRMK